MVTGFPCGEFLQKNFEIRRRENDISRENGLKWVSLPPICFIRSG